MLRQSTFVLCGTALVFTLAGLASATNYTLTDLGTLTGSTNPTSYALAVNNSGVVVGTSSTSKSSTKFHDRHDVHARLRGLDRYRRRLQEPVGHHRHGTFANAINDAGQVAGYLYEATPVNNTQSFIYNTGTQVYTTIAAQPGVCNGAQVQCGENMWNPTVVEYQYPGSINGSGQTVGEYTNTAGARAPSSGTAARQPMSPPPRVASAGSTTLAWSWGTKGGIQPHPHRCLLLGRHPDHHHGHGISPGDHRQRGGRRWPNTNGPTYTAIYTLGASSATYIGSAGQSSFANGVSSNGTVVGYNGNDAFVYTGGAMTDLNTLVQGGVGASLFSDLNVAYGISPNGEYIVGTGTIASNGFTEGFLLTAVPTPEPSTLLLAVGGVTGLLAYAWRKRK